MEVVSLRRMETLVLVGGACEILARMVMKQILCVGPGQEGRMMPGLLPLATVLAILEGLTWW